MTVRESARISLIVTSPGLLLGVRGIEVIVDGDVVDMVQFGEPFSFELAPGDHSLQIRLRAMMSRRSNVVNFSAAPGEEIAFSAKYSRMWGTLRLKKAPGA